MPELPLMGPALSLCIPTYNRAAFLSEALGAIFSQMDAETSARVEVIVSDNASTDDTAAVIKQMRSNWPQVSLRSVGRPQNDGADANIYGVFQEARGQFVYWLSDDDILLPGALARLLALMDARPDLDAFCLNVRSFVGSLEEPSHPWIPLREDQVFTDCNEALAWLNLTFLSTMALRRSLASRDYSAYVGTNLLQSYVFADALAQGRGVWITAQPFLAQRQENTGGYNFFRVMVTEFAALMAYAARNGYTKKAVAHVLSRHLSRVVFRFILLVKLTGRGNAFRLNYAEGFRRMLPVYGVSPFFWLAVVPLMLTPSLLLQLGRDCVRPLKALRASKASA